MVETTTRHGKRVGKFFKTTENDFNSAEFRDKNKAHEEISINQPESNSCEKNVIYYKLKSTESGARITWNWTIESDDENFFSKTEENAIKLR